MRAMPSSLLHAPGSTWVFSFLAPKTGKVTIRTVLLLPIEGRGANKSITPELFADLPTISCASPIETTADESEDREEREK